MEKRVITCRKCLEEKNTLRNFCEQYVENFYFNQSCWSGVCDLMFFNKHSLCQSIIVRAAKDRGA